MVGRSPRPYLRVPEDRPVHLPQEGRRDVPPQHRLSACQRHLPSLQSLIAGQPGVCLPGSPLESSEVADPPLTSFPCSSLFSFIHQSQILRRSRERGRPPPRSWFLVGGRDLGGQAVSLCSCVGVLGSGRLGAGLLRLCGRKEVQTWSQQSRSPGAHGEHPGREKAASLPNTPEKPVFRRT
ncbi:hypothetical protein CB1_000539007 [Camelus ferus]|nr:hypothetical protein CB1_000539007 [Camelus ferus]